MSHEKEVVEGREIPEPDESVIEQCGIGRTDAASGLSSMKMKPLARQRRCRRKLDQVA